MDAQDGASLGDSADVNLGPIALSPAPSSSPAGADRKGVQVDKQAVRSLGLGDQVVVRYGQLQGASGVIVSVDGDEVLLDIDANNRLHSRSPGRVAMQDLLLRSAVGTKRKGAGKGKCKIDGSGVSLWCFFGD